MSVELHRCAEVDRVRIENLATNLEEDLTISGCTPAQGLMALACAMVKKCRDQTLDKPSLVYDLVTEICRKSIANLE